MGYLNRKSEKEPDRVIKVQVNDLMVASKKTLLSKLLTTTTTMQTTAKSFSVWMK